jgi:hypothetical protein
MNEFWHKEDAEQEVRFKGILDQPCINALVSTEHE